MNKHGFSAMLILFNIRKIDRKGVKPMKKSISLLGSTGSIGKQAIDVILDHPGDFQVVALAAMKRIDTLEEQIMQVKPKLVAVYDEEKAKELRARVGTHTRIVAGMEGLIEAATLEEADLVLNAVMGSVGLVPTLEAIKNKKDIALANKETLVVAGSLVMEAVKQYQVKMIPVDSEHSAIFQCLQGEELDKLSKIIITASGGPFRSWDREKIAKATYRDALKHPNWSMGRKITIDSATLMNKGLEVIEAKWLFDVDVDRIEVVVHPESIIHSMIEMKDYSIIAQMGIPDMKLPIQYALTYPERLAGALPRLDFKQISSLSFYEPNTDKFPCLQLAYEALRIGGTMPCVVNGANEVLVESYLNEKINFYDIPRIIEAAMAQHQSFSYATLDEVLSVDKWVRQWVKSQIK